MNSDLNRYESHRSLILVFALATLTLGPVHPVHARAEYSAGDLHQTPGGRSTMGRDSWSTGRGRPPWVNLVSAGLDEVPMAYKDIGKVMSAQSDLVSRVARFDPRLVRMNKGR